VENIGVEEGFNPRTTFDPDEMAGLAASLAVTEGVVQPLAVKPIDGQPDKYIVVDGERRLRGLREAGVEKVPVLVLRSEKAMLAAMAANEQRVDLNPIESANGIKAVMQLHGLRTHKEVADQLGKARKNGKKGTSAAYVGEHLRLLKLPEAVQAYIAAGTVPVAAERNLRAVAKISVAVAQCACQLVERGEIEARALVEDIGQVLTAAAESDLAEKPVMIDALHGEGLSAIVTDADAYADLTERYRQVVGQEQDSDPFIRFGVEEVDAARAAGCLIEATMTDQWERRSTVAYLTDPAFAADLANRVIERRERILAEAVESTPASSVTPIPEDSPTAQEAAKQAARAERVKSRKRAEALHDDNTAVGRTLITRRGAKNRKENKLAWAKAVAAILLADHPDLAAAGLGLAFENLQEVERRTVKSSGEEVKKITYTDSPACNRYLTESIERATTADQVYELLGEALVALHAVDAEAVPQSRRPHCWMRGGEQAKKVLVDQIKTVRPRRRAAKRS
jgi:ParB/RepB/Spo0J family partition protein